MQESRPFISIVVPTYERAGQLAVCLRALAVQEYHRDRFEVIIVDDDSLMPITVSGRESQHDVPIRVLRQSNAGPASARNLQELANFCGNQVVEIGDMTSTARARAAGVHRATAPVVAFVEDHAFPAKGWAEALIHAHQKPWVAVGPMMANANPRNLVSWVNLIIEYAEWMEPVPAGVAEHLPGHNGTYKRALLMEYGDRLEAMLEAESILQWDLRAKGHQLYLEPAAKTYHQNFSAPFSWVALRLDVGQLFAASRARTWSPWRHLLYACAAPLIPLVRFRRIVGELRRPGRARHLMPRVLPLLFAGLVVDSTGEMIGYAFGVGNAMRRLSDMEFHRERYLMKHDRLATVEA